MGQNYGKITTYPDGSGYMLIYKQGRSTYDSGPEKKQKKDRDDLFELTDDERDQENVGRSTRRSKKAVREYAVCNRFTHFVTLTFRNGDDENAQSKEDDDRLKILSNWLKYMKKKHGKFNYVIVPERHKNNTLHFHGLLDLENFDLEKAEHYKTGRLIKRKGTQVYHITAWEKHNGWGHAEIIRDQKKISNYMTKYITKDFETTVSKHKKKYWCSKGLNTPAQERLRFLPQLDCQADWENDFVRLYNFDDINSIRELDYYNKKSEAALSHSVT